jgi:hypothetical protein
MEIMYKVFTGEIYEVHWEMDIFKKSYNEKFR